MENYERLMGYFQITDETYRQSDMNSVQVIGARLSESVEPDTNLLRRLQLGEYGNQKVFLLSRGFEGSNLESVSVIGGFCAIPTYTMMTLQRGYIAEPVTGEKIRLTKMSDLDAAEKATVVRVDKVLEAVGISRNATAVVSESQMWGNRLFYTLQERGVAINGGNTAIQNIVEESDSRAFTYLKNAFRLINPEGVELVRFQDYDIMADLIRIRDELFARYALNVEDNDSYSLIYASMYSGPYKEVLEREGYLPASRVAVIYEPLNHATFEQGKKAFLNKRMLGSGSKDQYLRQGGINESIGFIAFTNMMDSNGRMFRRFMPTSLLPNELNYAQFNFRRFPVAPKTNGIPQPDEFMFLDDVTSLTLSSNPAFLWATNLLPTNESLGLMKQMVDITQRYKQEKTEIKSEYSQDRESVQKAVYGAKTEARKQMLTTSFLLISELERQINSLFSIS